MVYKNSPIMLYEIGVKKKHIILCGLKNVEAWQRCRQVRQLVLPIQRTEICSRKASLENSKELSRKTGRARWS
jgi:hypothetical protein